MTPTLDWLRQAEKHIRHVLEQLRPQLLEAQGNIEHKLKDDKTIVTELDMRVEERLRESLAAFDPAIPFCGEEGGVNFNNIALGDYYYAIEGRGAFCNGHPLHVSNRPLDRSFVVLGSARSDLQEALKNKISNTVKMSSPGYEMTILASGAIEARIAFQGKAKPWDFAPGALLVQEAGGRVTNMGSDTYDYRNTQLIAANPVVFDELMRVVADLM